MIERPSPNPSNANAAMELGRLPIGTPRHIRAAVSCAVTALLLGLAACGGNDDDAPAVATGQSVINATNADRVALEAILSFALAIGKVSRLPSDDFVLDRVPASAAVRTRLLRAAPTGGALRPLAESINKTLCETSGSLTRNVSQAVERKLTVGDFAELQFDACVQSGKESVGKARETITAVNATQSIFEAHGEWTGFGTTQGVNIR